MRHLSKSVALHCARSGNGIRCNSVLPGITETAMLAESLSRNGADYRAQLEKTVPGELNIFQKAYRFALARGGEE